MYFLISVLSAVATWDLFSGVRSRYGLCPRSQHKSGLKKHPLPETQAARGSSPGALGSPMPAVKVGSHGVAAALQNPCIRRPQRDLHTSKTLYLSLVAYPSNLYSLRGERMSGSRPDDQNGLVGQIVGSLFRENWYFCPDVRDGGRTYFLAPKEDFPFGRSL
jgi:hypothetical protein